ncbi:hypothetical protein ACWECC_15400 [Streptomyces microflavus]
MCLRSSSLTAFFFRLLELRVDGIVLQQRESTIEKSFQRVADPLALLL